MTTMRSLAPVLLLALVPAAALADDFRWEVQGSYSRDMPEGDLHSLWLSGTWYFAPIATDEGPLAEAAFLGRASWIGAAVACGEIFGADVNAQAAQVAYYLPNTMFFATAGVSRSEEVLALSSTLTLKDYRTRWSGRLGITPLDGLLITTGFDEGDYQPNLAARHVGKLPNGHYYAGGVSIVDPDIGDTSFGLDFDYYLDDTTSIGAGYDNAGDRFELRAERFFSKTWAAGVSGYTADGVDGFGVHVTWRH